ncbi:MAG: Ig-like domain-containing protein [Spirochaetaceae bacterium]|jgi:hypothetical protein|nr:Ig-like domain-containing protein [Spirochaetaceae bacterium]
MFRWNKFFLPLLWAGFFSCGFADLRPVSVRTVPHEADSLLPDFYTPVIVAFNTEVERTGAEEAVSVTFNGGKAPGDMSWQGNEIHFTPAAGWSPGTRYTLSLSGNVFARDGRELTLAGHIPFYAVSKSHIPYLMSFEPLDGASVGVTPADGCRVRLVFTHPMDRKSVEVAFTLEGMGEKKHAWTADDRTLEISSADSLPAWTSYRWTLDETARSRDGTPLAKPVSAQFTTDLDRLFPQVVRVFPMVRSAASGVWQETGRPLADGLGSGLAQTLGIGIEFNKPMDRDSLLRAVRLDPVMTGRTELLSDSLVVYIPEKDPEPETVYTLIVSADTRDRFGLKMGTDYTAPFVPDIPYLKILSLTVEGIGTIGGLENGAHHRVPVFVVEDGDHTGVLRFTLNFSLRFSPEARTDTVFRVFLDTYFPGTISSVPSLRFAEWLSSDKLRMEWEGLDPSAGGPPSYYRLSLPGGRNGITNGGGSFFKEEIFLYLEVFAP